MSEEYSECAESEVYTGIYSYNINCRCVQCVNYVMVLCNVYYVYSFSFVVIRARPVS